MGVSWSSVSDCLGSISDGSSGTRYSRVPPSHRVAPSAVPARHAERSGGGGGGGGGGGALRQRAPPSEEKLAQCASGAAKATTSAAKAAASLGAATAPPPPPLVPDANAVYNLLEDEQEDVCPTCLECYEEDNPKISSACGHAFHLQCIVAWETRSGSRFCPICAKLMDYAEAEVVGGG